SAQEPEGYLHTCYTLENRRRWSNRADHEGYLAGYFIEAGIAHFLMTDRKDSRMYDAAKKLADCWCNNIGPAPKKSWYEGHQELEQALVRLARFVEEVEGAGKGRQYVELAKFLLDSRKNGAEYDQSHVPVVQQYEAVGHAVRAVYSYSGMTDVAMETGDIDYHSAVKSLWNNIVNKKYYVTGGLGSGETSEGFGKDYSLPNHAYCESCANCGELFFQYKMNLAYDEARYADLYEETIYNAILGDVDLEAKNFTYTNPLDSGGARYPWHGCPCCVGNIPRTLLRLPTWMYVKGADGIYVNLFLGSTVTVENVAGTDVQMVQTTDYPWSDRVSIGVQPTQPKRFTVRIRVPQRNTSSLYTGTPAAGGMTGLSVNGSPLKPTMDNGYAVITRTWKAGDKIDLVVPMKVQRVKADSHIAADAGRVALRYGPLVYNIESADQNLEQVLGPNSPLSTEWNPNLLGGVMVIKGTFTNGAPMMAIPNYARNNRGGRSVVWIKEP
ncbi:MAG: glycoside hydrolase family 127 protein, partial [Verrucomicrobia bacterium]|nr:glycoside hydrolase family 127 protein [Verrucomicrobiota bacterium]